MSGHLLAFPGQVTFPMFASNRARRAPFLDIKRIEEKYKKIYAYLLTSLLPALRALLLANIDFLACPGPALNSSLPALRAPYHSFRSKKTSFRLKQRFTLFQQQLSKFRSKKTSFRINK